MSGIELSEMTEELVFDDRPAVKPKAANNAQPAKQPAAQPVVQPAAQPVVQPPAQIDDLPMSQPLTQPNEEWLGTTPAKADNKPLFTAKIRPSEVEPPPPVVPLPQNTVPQPVTQSAGLPPVQPDSQANANTAPLSEAEPNSSEKPLPAKETNATETPLAKAETNATESPLVSSLVNTGVKQIQTPSHSSMTDRRIVRTDATAAQKKEAIDLFETLIASAAKGGASDIILKCGQVPMFRWNGELFPSRNGPRLEKAFLETLCAVILSRLHCERLNDLHDVDFGYVSGRGGRVRVNVFRQTGEFGLVARLIPNEIPNFEKLELDQKLKQFVEHKRGLVLVTGATGSGKSTTLAALLDYINNTRTSHIITIEDPVEFAHHDKRAVFNQRELGVDTRSFADALRSALRQAPDVILVGELRDAETTEIALQAAETGHLVLSTLHTNDAADSIIRILGMVGQEKEAVVRVQLADSLRGVISQRLIKRSDRSGRVAAQEVMVNTATIREKLLKGAHPSVVRDFIAQGGSYGMHTFDQHLIHLVKTGVVDYEEALNNATNRDDFALRFSGVSDGRQAS